MKRRLRLVILPCLMAVGAFAAAATTASLHGWRSADGYRGWRAGEGRLVFDRRGEGSLIAAEKMWDRRGRVTIRVRESYGPWARLEVRLRASGDERSYAAIAVEPERGVLTYLRKLDGRIVADATRSEDIGPLAPGERHDLAWRVTGDTLVVVYDGRVLFAAERAVPMEAGRVGLAAAYVHAELSGLEVVAGPPEAAETFESLDGWETWYGPDAWKAVEDTSRGEGNHVAAFAAADDGAILGRGEWSHVAVELKGKFVDASRTWACFGVRPKVTADKRSYYVAEVRGRQSTLAIWKLLDGKRDAAVERTIDLPKIEAGRWYTLRCELAGDRIRVALDGKQLVELTDPRPIERGRIAVSASHGTVHVDDLRITALESDYEFEAAERPPEPYDPGPALPAASPEAAEDGSYWYLASGALRAAIHKKTGMLGGLWAADGRRLIDRALCLYRLETRDSQTDASAYGDAVQKVVRRSPTDLVVQCMNKAMAGVAITKRYAFDPKGERLVQAVELTNGTDRPDLFITVAQRTVVDPAFRKDAIYTGGSYLGPLVPAASIRERVLTDAHKKPWVRGITNGRPSWILALNHTLAQHLASYRYRVNGHYTTPWNGIWTEPLHNLYHTPAGWEMGLCTLHLKPKETRSVEVHHTAFRGGRLGFYDAYMDLPDVAGMYARVGKRPAWLRDIKMPNWMAKPHVLAKTEDGILVHLRQPFGVWGDLPTSGTVRTAGGIARWPVERVRKRLAEVRAASPRIRAGFYTWAWSAHHKSEVVARHPEWFIPRDKAGKTRNAYPLALSFLRCLSAPGCLEATVQTYRDLVRYYDEDFQYLDNDGTSVQVIDWEHLRVDQDYHWLAFHQGLLEAARARSPETATFFNNRVLPQGDISFAEFMRSEIQNPDDWRRPANEMVPLKIFQKRDPDRVVALLYWRGENRPMYANYCVGLGLVPWGDRLSQLPFVNAAFETRRLELMDADLRPDWQRDLGTNVEAYALRQGNAAFVFLVGHGETPEEAAVSFDAERIGLRPGLPYQAWLFELKDDRDFAGRLTEAEQRRAYREAHWADELAVAGRCLEMGDRLPRRYERQVVTRPQRLRMLMVTQSPALVWSVDGQRQHFWLPATRHVATEGTRPVLDGGCEVMCRCEAERAEIVVPVPSGSRVAGVTVDGRAAAWAPERVDGAWLARVGVTRGVRRVAVRCEKAEGATLRYVRLEAPDKVEAGQEATVRASFVARGWRRRDGALLRVLRDGVLVASVPARRVRGAWLLRRRASAEFVLAVPETARPGLYDVAFTPVGAADDEPMARIEVLAGSWKPAVAPGTEHGKPVVKVWDVGKTIQGIEVLRAATDTFDHRGGTQLASLDVDKLRARCGLLDEAESPWGYGFCGIEIQGVKSVSVDVRNTFCEPHREGFELGGRYRDSFAGFILDYHTAKGYTHRVALGLGVIHMQRPVTAPNWGKAARPDRCVAWSKTLLEKPQDVITVPLGDFAPPDWDGRAWLSIGVDTVYRGLRLDARITRAASR